LAWLGISPAWRRIRQVGSGLLRRPRTERLWTSHLLGYACRRRRLARQAPPSEMRPVSRKRLAPRRRLASGCAEHTDGSPGGITPASSRISRAIRPTRAGFKVPRRPYAAQAGGGVTGAALTGATGIAARHSAGSAERSLASPILDYATAPAPAAQHGGYAAFTVSACQLLVVWDDMPDRASQPVLEGERSRPSGQVPGSRSARSCRPDSRAA
jgi:hypothetical protein